MEQVIEFNGARRERPTFRGARPATRLRRGLLAALQGLLALFLAPYPLLRLGYLGSVPESYALEAAVGLAAGVLAAALFVLERERP